MTDAHLLQQWIDEASHEAFDALVRRHVDMVHAVALRRVGDADLAQDVTQATFIVLARKARSVRRRASVAAWLHQVTRHAATDALRRRQVRAKREREAAMHADAEQRPADDPWLDVREHLEPALDRLPRRDREAILLRFYEQQTFEQIAAVQGVNVGTAHRRVHKALEKLAAGLRHRGVAVPAAALGTTLIAHATAAAPAGVAAGATSLALATGSLTGAVAGAGSLGIAKGAMTMMMIAKLKVAAALAIVAAMLTGAGAVTVEQATSGVAVAAATQRGTPAHHDAAEVDERLEFLFAQHDMAQERVGSARYSYRETYDTGEQQQVRQGEVLFSGPHRLVTRHGTVGVAEGLDEEPTYFKQIETRSVIGPDYAALWVTDEPVAYMYAHESPDKMRKETSDRFVSFTGQNLLEVASGTGSLSLRAIHGRFGNESQWRVVEDNNPSGEKLFIVQRFHDFTQGESFLQADYTINVDRGFAISRIRNYSRSGDVIFLEEIEVQDVTGHGDWMPVQYDGKHYRGSADGKSTPVLNSHRQIRFTYLDINQPVPEDRFSVESIGLPEGLLVAHKGLDGKSATYSVVQGRPEPEQIAASIRKRLKHAEEGSR